MSTRTWTWYILLHLAMVLVIISVIIVMRNLNASDKYRGNGDYGCQVNGSGGRR